MSEWDILFAALTIAVPIKLCAFFLGRLHRDSWRHAALQDLVRIGLVNLGASVIALPVLSVWVGPSFPRSVYAIDLLICFLLSAGARFALRLYNENPWSKPASSKGMLIYGTGSTGRSTSPGNSVESLARNSGDGIYQR